MLSEQLRQLLTAYVDGELTTRQRKAVARLLSRSPEARALLRKLQEDAQALRSLPRQRLGGEFTARVLQALRQRQARRREAARQAAFPAWAGFAAAAAVLLAVASGSFFFFTQPPANPAPGGEVAQNDPSAADSTPGSTPDPGQQPPDGGGAASTDTNPKPPDKPKGPPHPEELPMPLVINDKPKDPVKPDGPGSEGVVASPTPLPDMEMFKPDVVKPPFSLLRDVHDIQADALRKEIGGETALRVELPCRETAKAFRRLQAALKEVGVTLVIDQSAQNRLDKTRLKANYIFLVEDLTAEELARALAKAGSDDKKAAEVKPKPESQFTKMVVNRLSDADRKELSEVLRVDPRKLQAGASEGSKGTERVALAATYNPERPKVGSPEVKRYLDSRKPARTGTLQTLLVLRELPN